MPNTASAIRKVRVIKTKTLRNQMVKSALKTAIKNFEVSLKQDDAQAKTEAFRFAVKKIDQAVAKGIIHRNAGARKKSQLALMLNKA